jgi:phage head maturation protease
MWSRSASLQPTTWNADARTVDVIWTTGARIHRTAREGWGGTYDEELDLAPGAVRLDRLNSGAPFLAAHEGYRLQSVIGVVEAGSARIEDGKGIATIRLSDQPEDAPIVNKIASGIIQNVSVGFMVHREERIKQEDGIELRRAVDWEPYEISAVPMGADPDAHFRGLAPRGGMTMSDQQIQTDQPTSPAVDPTALDAAREEARVAERARIAAITALCKRHGCDSLAQALIEQAADEILARKLILDELAKRSDAAVIQGAHSASVTRDEGDIVIRGMSDLLMHVARPEIALTENGARFRGYTAIDLCRRSLELNGQKTEGMSRREIAGKALRIRAGAHSTSDFPFILANVANKSLRDAYDAAAPSYLQVSRRSDLTDLKTASIVQLGEFTALKPIPEGGEYQSITIGESREQWCAMKYGHMFVCTIETLINDDLGAFLRVPAQQALATRRKENAIFWALITGNQLMGDGVALFNASHSNIGSSGGAPTAARIAELEKLMMTQRGLGGEEVVGVPPRFLLAPVALKSVIEPLLSPNYVPTDAANAVIQDYRAFTRIYEPILDTSSTAMWYACADPAVMDTAVWGYLRDEQGPYLEDEYDFDRDLRKYKIREFFGAHVVEWRSWARNNGS